MSRPVRVKALVNKGRRGVSLEKFPRIVSELRQFLHLLAQDLGIDDSRGWQGVEFRETGSLEFIIESNSLVDEPQFDEFNEGVLSVVEAREDRRVSDKTRYQYSRVAAPIDPDESVLIGVERVSHDAPSVGPVFDWHELTSVIADSIAAAAKTKVTSLASVQGTIHSVFIEAERPHFQLRELSTKELITCNYRDSKYSELADALRQRKQIIHVYGLARTDMLAGKIESIDVESIDLAPYADLGALDRFIGASPGLVTDIQAEMNRQRRRGT